MADRFGVADALAYLEQVSPARRAALRPAPPGMVDRLAAVVGGTLPDEIRAFLEALGGGRDEPAADIWDIEINEIIAVTESRAWLRSADAARVCLFLGRNSTAPQVELFASRPFAWHVALVASQEVGQDDIVEGQIRHPSVIAGSLASYLCLPAFIETQLENEDGASHRWLGAAGQGVLMKKLRPALEELGFTAAGFSSRDAAAMTHPEGALLLDEHALPMEVRLRASQSLATAVEAVLREIAPFSRTG